MLPSLCLSLSSTLFLHTLLKTLQPGGIESLLFCDDMICRCILFVMCRALLIVIFLKDDTNNTDIIFEGKNRSGVDI